MIKRLTAPLTAAALVLVMLFVAINPAYATSYDDPPDPLPPGHQLYPLPNPDFSESVITNTFPAGGWYNPDGGAVRYLYNCIIPDPDQAGDGQLDRCGAASSSWIALDFTVEMSGNINVYYAGRRNGSTCADLDFRVYYTDNSVDFLPQTCFTSTSWSHRTMSVAAGNRTAESIWINIDWSLGVDYIYISSDRLAQVSPPPTLPGPTIPLTATCGIDTNGDGITETLSANLMSGLNGSFENGGSVPDGWQSNAPLFLPSYYYNGANAADGSRALRSNSTLPALQALQTISLPQSADGYLVGAYARQDTFTQTGNANIYLGIAALSLNPTAADAYQLFEQQVATFGSQPLALQFSPSGLSPDTYVDQIFIIPVEETNPISGTLEVYCPAVGEFYSPTAPITTTIQEVYGLPAPLFGAGNVCYSCRYQVGMGMEYAIVWLGCILRNMFSCDLIPVLEEILNALLGSFALGVEGWNWVSVNAQGFVNWLASFMQGWVNLYAEGAGLAAGGTIIPGTNIYDLLIALVQAPAAIIGELAALLNAFANALFGATALVSVILSFLLSLLDLLIAPLEMIFGMMGAFTTALLGAITAAPITIADFTGGDYNTGGLAAEGPTDAKVYTMFMWGFAAMDSLVISYELMPLVWFASGVAGFVLLYGLVRQWHIVTPV